MESSSKASWRKGSFQQHPVDNWMMHVVAEQIQPGDIVLVSITAGYSDEYFGDLLATSSGDVIVANDDGVVVVPAPETTRVAAVAGSAKTWRARSAPDWPPACRAFTRTTCGPLEQAGLKYIG